MKFQRRHLLGNFAWRVEITFARDTNIEVIDCEFPLCISLLCAIIRRLCLLLYVRAQNRNRAEASLESEPLGTFEVFVPAHVTSGALAAMLKAGRLYTRVKIEKINNLFQVDINRREQGCAAHYMNSIVNMLLQHCSTVTTWNNMVDNLFIVGRTTLFTPVDINLEQPVRF